MRTVPLDAGRGVFAGRRWRGCCGGWEVKGGGVEHVRAEISCFPVVRHGVGLAFVRGDGVGWRMDGLGELVAASMG